MASSFLFERRGLVVTLRICLLGAVVLGAALGFSAFVLEWSFDLSAQAFEAAIQSWGAWGGRTWRPRRTTRKPWKEA